LALATVVVVAELSVALRVAVMAVEEVGVETGGASEADGIWVVGWLETVVVPRPGDREVVDAERLCWPFRVGLGPGDEVG
jgi:hypothetical protein